MQQEEVKRLLDLLLSTDRLQILCLIGIGCDTCGRALFAAFEFVLSRVEGYDQIVDGCDDCFPHGRERLVEIDDQGILLATVRNQIISP